MACVDMHVYIYIYINIHHTKYKKGDIRTVVHLVSYTDSLLRSLWRYAEMSLCH